MRRRVSSCGAFYPYTPLTTGPATVNRFHDRVDRRHGSGTGNAELGDLQRQLTSSLGRPQTSGRSGEEIFCGLRSNLVTEPLAIRIKLRGTVERRLFREI